MTMDGRTSVLAKLTADVMAEKKTAARVLTPVEGEARPTIRPPLDYDKAPVAFPFDSPDLMQQALRNARREAEFVLEGIGKLEALFGAEPFTTEDKPKAADIQKEKEKAADEAFADRQKRLAEEAQAAVFSERLEEAQAEAPEMFDGWTCPDHGKAIDKTSTKTGRTYRGCPDCNQFER